jgi:hypothetical protein
MSGCPTRGCFPAGLVWIVLLGRETSSFRASDTPEPSDHIQLLSQLLKHALAVAAEVFLDALRIEGSDALVDRERLSPLGGTFAGVAVLDMAAADAFQGACFLLRGAQVAGDGQGLGVVLAGLLAGRGPGRELAEAIQRFGLAEPYAEFAEQVQGLLVAGCGGRVVPRYPLQDAELVEDVGLVFPVAKVAEKRQRLPLAGGGGPVVPRQPLHRAELVESVGLPVTVAEIAELVKCLLLGGDGGPVVSGQPLHDTQIDEGFALAEPVTEVTEQPERLPAAGVGGPVVPGQPLDGT